ncbi:hypothetical protein D6C88_10490, partial [Aureobasidium pullulans]
MLPWAHRYSAVQSSDQERNRPESAGHTRYTVSRKLFSRVFTCVPRLTLVLLVLGVFAYLCSNLSAIGHFLPSTTNDNLLESFLTDANLEFFADVYVTVDWSRFAYSQYVTEKNYLCNSLMIFETLHRLGSKAEPRDNYNVKLVPIHVQRFAGEATWGDSFTKLLAFNQTQYERVIILDSDANVLQPMDELFFLPRVPVAMPRAYWDYDSVNISWGVLENYE